MIKETAGNLLEAKAEALVFAVNCVGVMGKGIALQFRQKFPAEYFNDYRIASPTTAMTHIAIQEALDGKAVEWLEKVSDERYHF